MDINEHKLKKLEEIKKQGKDPYPHYFERTATILEIRKKYEPLSPQEKSEEIFKVAGRLYSLRFHGKATFADLRDETAKIQLFFSESDIGKEDYKFLQNYVEIGDIIGVKGFPFKTKRGELTLFVEQFKLLSKALSLLPEKFHGLKDTELRYRKRYLDFIVNFENRELFKKRALIIDSIREFLKSKGFLEVETPILQPVYGGANARPFETYHNFLQQKLYLRIAPELYLKRLLVGGFEKIFEIGKNFRNESLDALHNPEFTMIEIYEAYKDFYGAMDLTESLIKYVVEKLCGKKKLILQNKELDFSKSFERISMVEALKKYANIDANKKTKEELLETAIESKIDVPKKPTKGELIALLFESLVEKELSNPTFITYFPIEVSPLAKPSRKDPAYAERFELFILGKEIANGYSELNDPLLQLKRFKELSAKRRNEGLKGEIDYDYVNALSYGMPPAAGIGIGIDRLVMLLLNKNSIKEIILFPHVRKKKEFKTET